MLVADILHSCANECVAEAAVSSIGGEFTSRMRAEATKRGVSVGFMASRIVRDFARLASERDWRDLSYATRGHDFPVLAGLEVILSKPSGRVREDRRAEARPPAHGSASAVMTATYACGC